MDGGVLDVLRLAASVLLSWSAFGVITVGAVFGTILGALPGFGAAQALALLFPFTYGMSPELAILFFLSVYTSAEYGGSVPAILIRMPGTTASAVTVLEGYPLARRGYARRTLRISLISGAIGGAVSTVVFGLAGPALAWVGLRFGPAEMFALGVFGLSIVSSFFGKAPTWGLLSALLGLLLATIGSSDFGGMRFTFGQTYLFDGIPVIVMIIGFLAFPEALRLLIEDVPAVPSGEPGRERPSAEGRTGSGRDDLPWRDLRMLSPSILRGSLIGTAIGTLPGAGATLASLIAYNEEKRWSRRPELFGTGVEEGVASPEAANNAVVAGTLVPSLALGIPGSAAAAILLGLLISKGVVPGPQLFGDNPAFVVVVFLGLLLCNVAMLAVGLAGSTSLARVASLPQALLGPLVAVLLVIGAYSYHSEPAHVVMVMVFGVIAYLFEKLSIPVVPLVLGFVMGPIMEENFLRAMALHRGEISLFLTQPIAAVILVLALVTAIAGYVRSERR